MKRDEQLPYRYPGSEEFVTTWRAAWKWYRGLPAGGRWIFRGEGSDKPREIKSKIIRVFEPLEVENHAYLRIELEILKDFQRRVRVLGASVNAPKDEDFLGWLGLLRHFGGPTRLVDWTYSFYVACFFALTELAKNTVIWAVDAGKLRDYSLQALKIRPGLRVQRVDHTVGVRLFNRPRLCAYPLNSLMLNERSASQQGLFLAQGDLGKSFMENLAAGKQQIRVLRVKLDSDQRRLALLELHRMNMTHATLYPGLSGVAQSLSFHYSMLDKSGSKGNRVENELAASGLIRERLIK